MREVIEVPKGDGGVSQVILSNVERELPLLLAGRRVIVLTDSNVYACYSAIIERYEHIVIGLGEEQKTLATVESIYARLLEMGADRKSYIVGFGGGIVTDIAGFVASTYMRGLPFGFVATTLLSQVDASVGGKNGVNFCGYKNMVGTFNQPDFVICDIDLLKTLPQREFRAGLAEIIKCGLICDASLFECFERHTFSDFLTDKSLLHSVIVASIGIKARVVAQDEKETGERRKLNLGHTLAHAIEKSSRAFLHGEAVSIGLLMAAQLSHKHGTLSSEQLNRITQALQNAQLPTDSGIDALTLFEALKIDKKKESDAIHFIFMHGIGHCDIVRVPFEQLRTYLLGA